MNRFLKPAVALVLAFALLVPIFTIAADFNDIADGKWYSEAVSYVTDKGYFSGMTENTFEPKTQMSRAMFVTVLAALSGEDISDLKIIKFSDVSENSWYNAPVAWAFGRGIVSGTSDTTFSPKAPINRQEVCVMLCKYIDNFGYKLKETVKNPVASDDASISSWAKKSVYSISSYGIMTGKGNNVFDPKGTATRAEVAQMIMKLDRAIENSSTLIVDEVDIFIDGLEKTTRIMHVSDTHVTLTDENDVEDAVKYQDIRSEMFASEVIDGVTDTERFEELFAYADNNNVDLLALTGDIIDAPTSGNLNYFKNMLKNNKTDHLYALGNHDWTAEWLNSTHGGYQSQQQWDLHIPMFDGIIAEEEEKVAVREFDGFNVVAIDNSDNQISAAQFAEVFNYLDSTTPLILLMHVPMYVESMEADVTAMWGKAILMGAPATNPTQYTQMFCNMVKSKSSPVVAVLAGHVHMDHVDDLSENNDAVQYTLGASFKGYTRILNIHG